MIYHQSTFNTWPIPDNSVQSIITSPPYWSLRKYNIPDVVIGGDKNCEHEFINKVKKQIGGKATENTKVGSNKNNEANLRNGNIKYKACSKCNAFLGQYGLETDYKDYIAHTILWAKEAYRVLKKDGLFFLNLADTYKGNGGASRHFGYSDPKNLNGRNGNFEEPSSYPQNNIKPKSQMLIPHRIAIALIDEGWILRNTIIWYKPNAIPESVKDRFSKKYEYIFMFSKSERYKFNLDVVREPHKDESIKRVFRGVSNNHKWLYGPDGQASYTMSKPRPNRSTKIFKEDAELFGSPRARYHRENNNANTGENNKEPYKTNNPHMIRLKSIDREDGNFAVSQSDYFLDPSDSMLCILNPNGKNPGDVWNPPEGDVWNPPEDDINNDFWAINTQPSSEKHFAMWPEKLVERMILCSTDINDTVLDPFCGSGTTLKIAEKLNRKWIGIDLGYQDIQNRKIKNICRLLF